MCPLTETMTSDMMVAVDKEQVSYLYVYLQQLEFMQVYAFSSAFRGPSASMYESWLVPGLMSQTISEW
jgi:hypothetical protein